MTKREFEIMAENGELSVVASFIRKSKEFCLYRYANKTKNRKGVYYLTGDVFQWNLDRFAIGRDGKVYGKATHKVTAEQKKTIGDFITAWVEKTQKEPDNSLLKDSGVDDDTNVPNDYELQ